MYKNGQGAIIDMVHILIMGEIDQLDKLLKTNKININALTGAYQQSLCTYSTNILLIKEKIYSSLNSGEMGQTLEDDLFCAFTDNTGYFLKDVISYLSKAKEIGYKNNTFMIKTDGEQMKFITQLRNLFSHDQLDGYDDNLERLYYTTQIFNKYCQKAETAKVFNDEILSKLFDKELSFSENDHEAIEICNVNYKDEDIKDIGFNDNEHNIDELFSNVHSLEELLRYRSDNEKYLGLYSISNSMYTTVPNQFNDFNNGISFFGLSGRFSLRIEIFPFMLNLLVLSRILYISLKEKSL